MRALFLNHRSFDDAGVVGQVASELGYSVEPRFREDLEAPLDLRGVQLLISLGSWLNPIEDLRVPYIQYELETIRQARQSGCLVLGVCFGAQLLAHTLGGRIFKLSALQFGYQRVDFAEPGLAPTSHFFWNNYGFDAPLNSDVLARGDESCWAFQHGGMLGVQFHTDATAELLESWIHEPRNAVDDFDADRMSILADARTYSRDVRQSCTELMGRLLQ